MTITILARYLDSSPVALILVMFEEVDSLWIVGNTVRIFPTDEFMMARCVIRLLEIWEEGFRAGVDLDAELDEDFYQF